MYCLVYPALRRLRTLGAVHAEAEARSAAHAAGEEVLRMQLKSLQAEAAALQQELVRTGAAAGAAAAAAVASGVDAQQQQQFGYLAGGSPMGVGACGVPLQLPQALRELGQQQRRAQQAELLAEEVGLWSLDKWLQGGACCLHTAGASKAHACMCVLCQWWNGGRQRCAQ
jgi:hypothetical protein